jgi:hypothetical protein
MKIYQQILGSLAFLFFCQSGWAASDYPLEYKVAMFDAAEVVCRPIGVALFKKISQPMRESFRAATEAELQTARGTVLYKELYSGGVEDFGKVVKDSSRDRFDSCKTILRYGDRGL